MQRMHKMGESVRRLVKGLGVLALAGVAWGQTGIIPTVFYQPLRNVTGPISIQTIAIPGSYMIGQYTHTLSIILNNNGGTCSYSQLVVGMDGSFDNVNWQSLGAPISTLTGTPGVTGQLTGLTILYGAYPFLRVNIRRAFGTNCTTNINYVGSTTPVSFSSSTPQGGEAYANIWLNKTNFITTPVQLAQTFNLGGRLNIYGLSIHNNDATTTNTYTLQLYNKGTGLCGVGSTGTEEDLATYTVAAGGIITLGYTSIPIYQFPNSQTASAPSSLNTYDPQVGFYQVCLIATGAQLTTVNISTRTF